MLPTARSVAFRSRSRTSGRSVARGAPRRGRAARADAPRRVRPVPRAARRRSGDRRGREHARVRRRGTGHISAYGPTATRGTPSAARGLLERLGRRRRRRLVAGAVGADGVGSIRYPGSRCGITGLKPTFGRSAMEGHHLDTTTIVSARCAPDAADCRLLGGVLFGEGSPPATRTACGSGSSPGRRGTTASPR